MPYIVINSSNDYDPNNKVEYATADEADAKAREILQSQPQATVRTAQLLNTYSAKVSVSVKAIPDAPADDTVPAE
jgi:hypothetical protein